MKKTPRLKDRIIHIRYLLAAVIIGLSGLPGIVLAQDTYSGITSPNASIKVLGTSNLHDWSMEAKAVTSTAKFICPAGSNQPQSLAALNLALTVANLKSGESLMDSRAYTALKANKAPTISFVLTSGHIVRGQGGQFQVKSNGNLSIAGATKPVDLDAACQVNPDGTITCSGTEQLKMSDYGIKPPTFMLGALRTGDALTVNFSLVFKK